MIPAALKSLPTMDNLRNFFLTAVTAVPQFVPHKVVSNSLETFFSLSDIHSDELKQLVAESG